MFLLSEYIKNSHGQNTVVFFCIKFFLYFILAYLLIKK